MTTGQPESPLTPILSGVTTRFTAFRGPSRLRSTGSRSRCRDTSVSATFFVELPIRSRMRAISRRPHRPNCSRRTIDCSIRTRMAPSQRSWTTSSRGFRGANRRLGRRRRDTLSPANVRIARRGAPRNHARTGPRTRRRNGDVHRPLCERGRVTPPDDRGTRGVLLVRRRHRRDPDHRTGRSRHVAGTGRRDAGNARSFALLLQLVNIAKDVESDYHDENNVYLPPPSGSRRRTSISNR